MNSVTISGCVVFLGDCENKVSIVKLSELHTELPDLVVIGPLSHYGHVVSFRRDRVAEGIYNGVRTARMIINRPIPAKHLLLGSLYVSGIPINPRPATNVVQKGTLLLRVNHIVLIVSSLATVRRTILCRLYVVFMWPIPTQLHTALMSITVQMFFLLRSPLQVMYKPQREASERRKRGVNRPEKRNATGRRGSTGERRRNVRRAHEEHKKLERREKNAERENAEREKVESRSTRRSKKGEARKEGSR